MVKVLFQLTILILIVNTVTAQSIQVFRGLIQTDKDQYKRLALQQKKPIAQTLIVLDMLAANSQDNAQLAQIQTLISAARSILDSELSYDEFNSKIEQFETLLNQFISLNQSFIAGSGVQSNIPVVPPLPTLHILDPEIVFTAGLGYNFSGTTATGISTNLLGGAAGAIFETVLGENGLSDYLTNNISGGISLPLSDSSSINGALGFGIGVIATDRFIIAPTLTFEQIDRNEQVPALVANSMPDQESWSSPGLSVGLLFKKKETIGVNGKNVIKDVLVPVIVTLGIQFPFYYPGNSYQSMVAIFSDNRGKFIREGGIHFNVGLSFPLNKAKPINN